MRGRIVGEILFGANRKQRITLELDGDFRDKYDRLGGKELEIEIKQHRPRRSLNANAYFHVLVGKIAEEQGLGEDEVKVRLVCEYGKTAKYADGKIYCFKLPVGADPSYLYPYVKCFDTREENGVLMNYFMAYKHTSDMDSAEMARLIDGAVHEARELGIETDPPHILARYKEEWSK